MSKLEAEIKALVKRHGFVELNNLRRSMSNVPYRPDYIVDVGVRNGTPWLYSLYENSHFLLVDPQKQGEAIVEGLPDSYRWLPVAVGSKAGRIMLSEQGGGTTSFDRTELTRVASEGEFEVEITTLDHIVEDNIPHGNSIGLKLDIEGGELDAIKGLNERLEDFKFIVSEVSVKNRFLGSYEFSDMILEMRERGFRFYNIGNSVKSVPSPYYDIIFLRADDQLFDRR